MTATLDQTTTTGGEVDTRTRLALLNYVLEETWQAIREEHPEIPEVVVVVGPVSLASGRADRYGHFGPARWTSKGQKRAEVLISAEGLGRGARQVFRTLLHESVHAFHHATGVKDCTQRGIHNAAFKAGAESFGLCTDHEDGIGCTTPDITDACAVKYGVFIERIARVLTLGRVDELASIDDDHLARAVFFLWAAWGHGWNVRTGGEGAYGLVPRTRRRSAQAGENAVRLSCQCGRTIRAFRSTIDQGAITCGVCESDFA